MCWNKPFFHTVKFRIALSYAALFLLSFLTVFCVVYFLLAAANRNAADARLNAHFCEIEYEYLTGKEPESGWIPVRSLNRVPEKIYQRIAGELAGFTPLLAFRNNTDKRRYQLFGQRGRQLYRIDVGAEDFSIQEISFSDRTEMLANELKEEAIGATGKPTLYLLLDASGKLLAHSPLAPEELEIFQSRKWRDSASAIQYETVSGARHRIRVAARKLFNGERLILGEDMHPADETLDRVAAAFLWVGLAVFVFSALTGWLLAKKMFRGVDRVGSTARQIAAGDYSLRAEVGNDGTEVRELVADFNFMVDSTEKLMTELRTISDDIAHDLRTPLTRMLTCTEVTFSAQPELDIYRDALADNADECRRMLILINTMLEISRTESGISPVSRESFDFSELLRHSLELFQMPAEQKSIALTANLPSMPVFFCGDRMKIQQLFANLIDNALKFTPAGGSVALKLRRAEDRLIFSVSDTGRGIADADKKQVFKRFYRADSSRNQPGNGLGLSLVQAIVHAHGGTIDLQSEPGKGTAFTVVFPCAADAE